MQMVKALPEHFEDYFFLRCDENNILWSGHKQAPDHDKLKSWYLQNITRADRLFFLCYEDKKIIGYLYMDSIGEKKDIVDIGYGVHESMAGQGYGTRIVDFAYEYARKNIKGARYMNGWVAEDNAGSVKVFLKNGYAKTPESKEIPFEKTGKKMRFFKYILELPGKPDNT
jgi:RimJ/RimL family protein N-acetyltransferase